MTESRFDVGMKVRKEVLGSEYVEQAFARSTEFDTDFQRFITEAAWGSVLTVYHIFLVERKSSS